VKYQVFIKRSAEKDLDKLPLEIFNRIQHKLLSLEENPRPYGIQKLHGQEACRIRIGDYRVLYLIHDSAKKVEIISVVHRREAYR